MWLINVNTLDLEEFIEPDFPYAILSHTWGSEEVSFCELKYQTDDNFRRKDGYLKIYNTCRVAKSLDLAYAWVDTCCIDKRSSAELSEAINSMFRWYKRSWICFAYLSDLNDLASSATFLENLGASRWFTRGWTLQELIAPKTVTFYNASWQVLGSKETLSPFLSSITGIDEAILTGKAPLLKVPAATRMSWASKRQTTRTEDSAYCLLGIFDINMPLLYGEGDKAFARLQSEILQDTNDLSLFAWTSTVSDPERSEEYSGSSKFPPLSTYSLSLGIMVAKTLSGFVRHNPWSLAVDYVRHHGKEDLKSSMPWMETFDMVSTIEKANLLKLVRHLTSEAALELQNTRLKNAVFISVDDVKRGGMKIQILQAEPKALWDRLGQGFLDRLDKASTFPNYDARLLHSSLLSGEKFLLVIGITSGRFTGPRPCWAALLNYHDAMGKWIIDRLDGWDVTSGSGRIASVLLRGILRGEELFHEAGKEDPFTKWDMPSCPYEYFATNETPVSRKMRLSDGTEKEVTISIFPHPAAKGACRIVITFNVRSQPAFGNRIDDVAGQ
ncbi:hypothetical protein SGCOL_005145 [Colletotrichum sp. CLE4]